MLGVESFVSSKFASENDEVFLNHFRLIGRTRRLVSRGVGMGLPLLVKYRDELGGADCQTGLGVAVGVRLLC